jgi:hypothetical protein
LGFRHLGYRSEFPERDFQTVFLPKGSLMGFLAKESR